MRWKFIIHLRLIPESKMFLPSSSSFSSITLWCLSLFLYRSTHCVQLCDFSFFSTRYAFVENAFVSCLGNFSFRKWQVFGYACQIHYNFRFKNFALLKYQMLFRSALSFMNGVREKASSSSCSLCMCNALLWFSLAFNLSFHDTFCAEVKSILKYQTNIEPCKTYIYIYI